MTCPSQSQTQSQSTKALAWAQACHWLSRVNRAKKVLTLVGRRLPRRAVIHFFFSFWGVQHGRLDSNLLIKSAWPRILWKSHLAKFQGQKSLVQAYTFAWFYWIWGAWNEGDGNAQKFIAPPSRHLTCDVVTFEILEILERPTNRNDNFFFVDFRTKSIVSTRSILLKGFKSPETQIV